MKRIIACLAILMALITLMTGCSGGAATSMTTAGTTAATKTNATTAVTTTAPKEPLELIWLGTNAVGVANVQGSTNSKWLEKKYNVKIKVTPVDQFNNESWNLYWASGNTADMIFINGTSRGEALIEQGLVRSINNDMLNTYMPTWIKTVESLVDKSIIDKQIKVDGKIFYVPFSTNTVKMNYVAAIRQDWMTKVGISKLPATIDEFEAMLKAFSQGDPDGNGKADTYGMESEPYNRFSYVFGAYGTQYNAYHVDSQGKIFYTPSSDDYKAMLKKLNSWLKAGYIDPEFVTDNRATVWNKWAESKIGVISESPFWLVSTQSAGPIALLKAKKADAKVVFAPAFTGPNGQSGASQAFPSVINNSVCFGSKTSDEKVIKIMQILEGNVTDWNQYLQLQYGELGITYYLSENVPQLVADYAKNEKLAEYGLNQIYGLAPLSLDVYQNKLSRPVDADLTKVYSSNKVTYMGAGFVYSGINKSFNTQGAGLKTISDEFYYNAISGNVNIDAEWNNYISKLKAAGMDNVCEEYQALYSKSNVK